MREEIYNGYLSEYGQQFLEYCRHVPLDKCELDENKSQVRAKGHAKDKVSGYANQFAPGGVGQRIPVSARVLPDGRYEVKDGCTRFLGHQRAGSSEILITTFQDEVLKFTKDDWDDAQPIYNDHQDLSPNTDDDIKHQIQKRLKSGRLTQEVGFKYDENPAEYVELGVKHVMTLYKNSRHNKTWFTNRLKECLKGKTTVHAKNYIKGSSKVDASALSSFKVMNNIQWTPEKARTASSSKGWVVYECDGHSRLYPNVMGNILKKKIDGCQDKFAICAWVGDLGGKNSEAILKERNNIVETIKKTNEYRPGFIQKLSFLPQIKSGPHKDDFEKLIEASLD